MSNTSITILKEMKERLTSSKTGLVCTPADYISSKTHFTPVEVKSLLFLFDNICSASRRLDRIKLREFLSGCFDITDDLMLDFLFRAFDTFADGYIDEFEFIMGLSTMIRGSPEELAVFCYTCFDINGNGGVDREEIKICLRGSILSGYGIDDDEIDDAEKDLAEIVMRKLDRNGDGLVSPDEFYIATKHEPLLLQCVGSCLPNPPDLAPFLATFTDDIRSYTESGIPTNFTRESLAPYSIESILESKLRKSSKK